MAHHDPQKWDRKSSKCYISNFDRIDLIVERRILLDIVKTSNFTQLSYYFVYFSFFCYLGKFFFVSKNGGIFCVIGPALWSFLKNHYARGRIPPPPFLCNATTFSDNQRFMNYDHQISHNFIQKGL